MQGCRPDIIKSRYGTGLLFPAALMDSSAGFTIALVFFGSHTTSQTAIEKQRVSFAGS